MNNTVAAIRSFMWNDDYQEVLARNVLRLREGQTVADVGCGDGYLSRTYYPYVHPGGSFTGYDVDREALSMAAGLLDDHPDWNLSFEEADAYALPAEDGSVDRVVCQTLLMHLAEPERAIDEMLRILRPGGWIVCMEPDMLLSSLSRYYPDDTDEQWLDKAGQRLRQFTAMQEAGRGDFRIGRKLPDIFSRKGLRNVEMRLNDAVYQLIPPYEPRRERGYRKFMEQSLKPSGGTGPFGQQGAEADGAHWEQLKEQTLLTHVTNMLYIVSGQKENHS